VSPRRAMSSSPTCSSRVARASWGSPSSLTSTTAEVDGASALLQDSSMFPVTSSLNNLRGQFFTDNNLVAAASVIVAMPTLIVFFVLKRQFVAGLTLGATKG
jgi:ABC-type maltose transport system permease subunit